jgi:Ca2+-binding RTX toxin-like protein
VDRISYRLRTRGITAGVAFTSAGARGEGDILRNFERVEGGRGPDRILGFMFGDGGPGNDVVTGGNRGRFFLTGGPGADTLRGFAGDDIINARDGQRDRRIECGAGFDTALLDQQDPAPVGGGCERVLRRG